MFFKMPPTWAVFKFKFTSHWSQLVLSQSKDMRKKGRHFISWDNFGKTAQMFHGFNLDIKLRIFEQVAVSLNEAHVGDFLSETWGHFSEIFWEAQPDSPRLVFCSLNDQGHDECLVLIFGQDFADFLERLSGKDSDLILLISWSMFQDGNERR